MQGLHKIGFRVVLDVVYNHTYHSLQDGGLIRIIQAVAQIQCELPLYIYPHLLGSAGKSGQSRKPCVDGRRRQQPICGTGQAGARLLPPTH